MVNIFVSESLQIKEIYSQQLVIWGKDYCSITKTKGLRKENQNNEPRREIKKRSSNIESVL